MDKELLYKRKARLDTDVVELADGIKLTVRALARGEVAAVQTLQDRKGFDESIFECHLIAAALVDPVMTVEEVQRWILGEPDDADDDGAPAGDSQQTMAVISRLSGIGADARKSVVP